MKLTGWSRIHASNCLEWDITRSNLKSARDLMSPIIPRGMGRAYGDASTADHGTVINTRKLNKIISLNNITGVCEAESGVTFEELLSATLNSDWYPPVVPGSRYISLGGAFASDVHGKNHFREGSFSNHVISIEILLPNGEVTKSYPNTNDNLFSATAGGMGLTGVILSLEIQLKRSDSNQFTTEISIGNDFTDTLELLMAASKKFEYSIAWVDFANSKKFGRSVVYKSNRNGGFEVKASQAPKIISIPHLPINLVSKPIIKLFNIFRFNRQSQISAKGILPQSVWEVLFPSDLFNNWNRLFGRNGLMEYQFIFSAENQVIVDKLLREICKTVNPALCAIKVLGEGNRSPMSFPRPGYLVGITFPWKEKFHVNVEKWDQTLVTIGARKYLSKDVLSTKRVIEEMYPEIESFRSIRLYLDKDKRFNSDLAKRVF
jgi:decaprenylphospho-beta-D-ribofuranose 2-oxidase